MRFLFAFMILAVGTSAFALDCEERHYVVHVDPKTKATRGELMHLIRTITDYSNGLSAGDLKHTSYQYPILTVNYDAHRGSLEAFDAAIASLRSNRGLIVECAKNATL